MEVEICVLGGGPAGSVTAQRLARLGHDVLLVDRGGNAKPHRTESLASAVPPILDSLCLQESLHRASFCCESHALLRWESDTVQIDRRHRGPSHLIDREQFDKCLREAASSASVRLVTPARAHAPRRHAAGGWDIRLSAPDDSRSIRARFLVDARGRRHGNETDGTQPPPASDRGRGRTLGR
jgi:flavin-dependent dehydrogenase